MFEVGEDVSMLGGDVGEGVVWVIVELEEVFEDGEGVRTLPSLFVSAIELLLEHEQLHHSR